MLFDTYFKHLSTFHLKTLKCTHQNSSRRWKYELYMIVFKILFPLTCFITVVMLINNMKYVHRTESYLEDTTKDPDLKYILLWTSPYNKPFLNMAGGQKIFQSRNCSYTNCVVTTHRRIFADIALFDVIVFNADDVFIMKDKFLPDKRSAQQKYVLASVESCDYSVLCSNRFDGYFNWTWTYRLDSEVRWGFIVVRDYKGNVIGPKKTMNWIPWEAMKPTSEETKEKLKMKKNAVAWFESSCKTTSKVDIFARNLRDYLRLSALDLDIYGTCGNYYCASVRPNECYERIKKKKYYFYLSFERGLGEDYVTDTLLFPLQNDLVPIVYGAANYSRFLPNGSYIDARELGLKALGDKIIRLLSKPEEYAEYFRWKNHYSYHSTSESKETDEYCNMCALINSKEMTKHSVYKTLRKWWDPTVAQQIRCWNKLID